MPFFFFPGRPTSSCPGFPNSSFSPMRVPALFHAHPLASPWEWIRANSRAFGLSCCLQGQEWGAGDPAACSAHRLPAAVPLRHTFPCPLHPPWFSGPAVSAAHGTGSRHHRGASGPHSHAPKDSLSFSLRATVPHTFRSPDGDRNGPGEGVGGVKAYVQIVICNWGLVSVLLKNTKTVPNVAFFFVKGTLLSRPL